MIAGRSVSDLETLSFTVIHFQWQSVTILFFFMLFIDHSAQKGTRSVFHSKGHILKGMVARSQEGSRGLLAWEV